MIELDDEVKGRLAGAIDSGNVLTAAYVDGDVANRVYYTFEGRDRVAEDVRQRVYDGMHPIERQFDPEAGGVPVVVELDRFTQLSIAGKVVQER